MTTHITLSRCGHYTVTIRDLTNKLLYKETKISCLAEARRLANVAKADLKPV